MSALINYLFTLFSLTITIKNTYAIIKSVQLTPFNKQINDTKVITNINEIITINNGLEWGAFFSSQNQWQYIIFVDHTFGFDEYVDSSLRFTVKMNAPTPNINDALLLGFTSTNREYIAFKIPLAGNAPNQIIPACHQSPISIQPFTTGDIASIPTFNHRLWQNMIPQRPPGTYESPSWLSFTLENHPDTNTMSIYFDTNTNPTNFRQTCHFGAIFPNNNLKIYLTGINPIQTYTISSFDIQSRFGNGNFPTENPTVSPTKQPTNLPSNFPTFSPTKQPSNFPTENPTVSPTKQPTNLPSNFPTFSPTINTNIPTISPTKFPTVTPTFYPTAFPTVQPTLNPSISPTTKFPTKKPSYNPTNNPSISPSNNPSVSPSNYPSKFPSKFPSVFPSITPTISPTNEPTLSTIFPTDSPTYAPVLNGQVYGAYNQICEYSVNKLCNENNNILSDANSGRIICLEPYDCCLCTSINCGSDRNDMMKCLHLTINGAKGIFGVQNINLIGNPRYGAAGTDIVCLGSESCKQSVINAIYVSKVKCYGTEACQEAVIKIKNPKSGFVVECTGYASCNKLKIEVDIPFPIRGCGLYKQIFEWSKIKCSNEYACDGIDITINNKGCDIITIGELDCTHSNACNDAVFNLIGDINIKNCECGPSCNTAIGLNQCFENMFKMQCN
eukprot:98901_1